ncbi:T9SS type A sorting domain-containing protein [Dyadobacter psychrotolerans]|uniref:T9SS type A sorting domain-containing protein n=1 Tax=Dyadobacter psychrotolerans TaxID=2541721 RepID=A0A4R5DIH6_9BACT|nr:sialate O-acetylesterase [Dyadobacter psychrotolerans]TDE13719.1 T9SS type A sorting domain-containing protein [Dyadobacter psychrotolerans]
MRNNSIFRVMVKTILLLCSLPAAVFSQQTNTITITSPVLNAVYQRDVKGEREITVAGSFTVPMDKIEVRAVAVVLGQGIDTPWKDLQIAPKGGVFEGKISIYAGWYSIELRGTQAGQVVGRAVLQRLGVGEVFIISGQSNAQGLKAYPGPSAVDERVQYISNYNNDSKDELTDPPRAVFSKITADIGFMAPRGQSAWCWGILGDLLVARLNMPVLFINTAWEGSAVENWVQSSNGILTQSKYGAWYPPQMPYANLRIAARNYAAQYGARAILWMQGETDGLFSTPASSYRNNLQFLMNKLEADAGRKFTWVIARTSRTSPSNTNVSSVFPEIIAAQNAVLDAQFNPTYPGPETDALVPNRPDGTHFIGAAALTILANAWNQSLDARFFSTVTPHAPAPLPAVSASCVAENNAVTITLPTGYASYKWTTGETTNSIRVTNAGSYSATVKDAAGNSILSPIVILEKNAVPAQPTIVQQGQQQACADSSFTFSVASGNDTYSWSKVGTTAVLGTGTSIKIAETGNYQVRGQNIYGCISTNSAASSLIIRPKITKPVIESAGPFSVTASIAETGLNEQYLWRRPGTESDTLAKIIKILKTGTYSTKARVVFTLGSNSLICYSDTASRQFETNVSNEVVIYPNPSQGAYIYIESRDNINDAIVTMYDTFGRVIKMTPPRYLDSRLEIDVSLLPSGKYIMRVTGRDTSLTKQIIIR